MPKIVNFNTSTELKFCSFFNLTKLTLSFSISAYSIKCYVCRGTEETCSKDKLEGDDSKQETCPGDANQCIRIWVKNDDQTTVVNRCGNDKDCEILKKVCDEIKEKCAVGCCDKDLCNAGLFPSACCWWPFAPPWAWHYGSNPEARIPCILSFYVMLVLPRKSNLKPG